MPKKTVSAFLVFAVALVTVVPRRVFAQVEAPPATSTLISNSSGRPASSSSDLRKSLAAEVAKVKAGPLTKADLKRIEKEHQNQQSGEPSDGRWTKKNTIFMALFIVLMTGLVVVLIKHACKEPKPCPEIDPTSDY